MSETLLEQLSRFAAATSFDELPAAVTTSAGLRFLDTLGISLAASAEGLAGGVLDLVDSWGGRPEAGVVGADGRYPAAQSALVGGTLAHSLDFDDSHLPSLLHPSSSVIPAVVAVGEATEASGPEILTDAAVGIELTVRLGLGGYLSDGTNVFFEQGWHATSICGALGAAAATAKLLHLDAERIADAMGIAASFGAGILEANRAGGTVKRLHCGWAAHAGVTAAQLAARGYTAPVTALEGRFGFYHAHLGERFDPAIVVEALGSRWHLPDVLFKLYPANYFTHAAIDAVGFIRREYSPDPTHITKIELGTARPALRTIGEPRAEKIAPQSGYHAEFSGPFAVATAFLGGRSGMGAWFDDFTDERARDPQLLALTAKVETFVDAECDAIFPRQLAAVVRVHMDDGRVLEKRVMSTRGGPGNPLHVDELRRKYDLNAIRRIPEPQAKHLADTALSLPNEGPGAAHRLMDLAR